MELAMADMDCHSGELRTDKILEAYSFVIYAIASQPMLYLQLDFLGREFNIFVNFNMKFFTHWQKKKGVILDPKSTGCHYCQLVPGT